MGLAIQEPTFQVSKKACRSFNPPLPSLKLRVRTWKWMVGRLVSFWDGLCFREGIPSSQSLHFRAWFPWCLGNVRYTPENWHEKIPSQNGKGETPTQCTAIFFWGWVVVHVEYFGCVCIFLWGSRFITCFHLYTSSGFGGFSPWKIPCRIFETTFQASINIRDRWVFRWRRRQTGHCSARPRTPCGKPCATSPRSRRRGMVPTGLTGWFLGGWWKKMGHHLTTNILRGCVPSTNPCIQPYFKK